MSVIKLYEEASGCRVDEGCIPSDDQHLTPPSHVGGFEPGGTETYPMVELKISVERDLAELERVMDAILHVHHYEEPVIFVREDWASRASYNPNSDNPHRWWNND